MWGVPKWFSVKNIVRLAAVVIGAYILAVASVAALVCVVATAGGCTGAAVAGIVSIGSAGIGLIASGLTGNTNNITTRATFTLSFFAGIASEIMASSSSSNSKIPAAEEGAYTKPGPFANGSIPARSTSSVLRVGERSELNQIGYEFGCHSCGTFNPGTISGNFVGDHQPISSLNFIDAPQQLYPHCLHCSSMQGAEAAGILRELGL